MESMEQLPNKLLELHANLVKEISEVAMIHGANELIGEMRDRIFNKGLNSSGNPIGNSYSTTPTYVSKDVFIRKGSFTPKGKENKGNFKNGKERKTMYLEQGYKELRDIQGRQTAKVDWRYSGSLEKSIEAVREDSNSVLVAITDGLESSKRKGLEEQSGQTVFTPSESDIQHYEEVMGTEIDKIFKALP